MKLLLILVLLWSFVACNHVACLTTISSFTFNRLHYRLSSILFLRSISIPIMITIFWLLPLCSTLRAIPELKEPEFIDFLLTSSVKIKLTTSLSFNFSFPAKLLIAVTRLCQLSGNWDRINKAWTSSSKMIPIEVSWSTIVTPGFRCKCHSISTRYGVQTWFDLSHSQIELVSILDIIFQYFRYF